MSIPVSLGTTGNTLQGPKIQRSLRFRSSASAYLSRTQGSGSATKATYSVWFKRGVLSVEQYFWGAGSSGSNEDWCRFNADNTLQIQFAGGSNGNLTSVPVYRDPSAWYHFVFAVDTTQATATNRVKVYVNNAQISLTGTSQNGNNLTGLNASGVGFYLMQRWNNSGYTDGYLAEVNFIDGQALTPSSFGYTNSYGVWQPTRYTGTYGTNGFYLPFTDNTSATTLAYDKSGNGNNWTANNISTTAGATYDSMTDVPTLTSATAANFCTLNPTAQGQFSNSYSSTPASATGATLTQGNLYATGANAGTGAYGAWVGTMPLNDGKWYWESTLIAEPTADFSFCGIVRYDNGTTNTPYFPNNGSYTVNDVLGFTWDDTAKELKWYKNGTLQATLVTGATGSYLPWVGLANANVMAFNFGQRPFSQTVPTGFKALNTFNLPDPTIKKPNQYMDATTYTGNGTGQSVVNTGGFQPDFLWLKTRSTANQHNLYDSVRGVTKVIFNNGSLVEQTSSAGQDLISFNSNGFTVGVPNNAASTNTNASTIVAWQWKGGGSSVSNTAGSITSTISVNPTAGFSVVSWTGTGTNSTVGHGLGVAPKFLMHAVRATTYPHCVWHGSFNGNQYLSIDGTGAVGSDSTMWGGAVPTSTTFPVGTNAYTNINGYAYITYAWAEIPGYSKFGSYTGNGSTDGPFVYCGFRPKFIMVKASSTGGVGYNWVLYDTSRSPYNVADLQLAANLSDAEAVSNQVDILSNGFKVFGGGTRMNGSGTTYIYAAFAENPFKYSNAR